MSTATSFPSHAHVAIIGAGFAGIGAAIKLRQAGIDDVVLFEKAAGVGGVWRANDYPGCACDVPSALYSYSFAPNPDWSRAYGRQPEILAYLERVAHDHAVDRLVRTSTELREARWDESSSAWSLDTTRGALTADVLIVATGLFGDPVVPDLLGLDRFAGTSFHSLDWRHDHDLRGRRVAVIGTGASAVQFVPAIQPQVAQLTIFQRSAPWIMPRIDRRTSALERALLRRVPVAQRALRLGVYALIEAIGVPAFVDQRVGAVYEAIGRHKLRRAIPDRGLRRALTPDYRFGCKRAILSDAYLPALTQPNVEVVTDPIAEVTDRAVVTRSGARHDVDTIIFGTGFETPTRAPSRVIGSDGRSFMDCYDERPQSYLGVAAAGFPNCFTTLGPFGAAGNQSAIFMIERQIDYLVEAITEMDRRGAKRIEVEPAVQDAFVAEVEARSADTVWLTGGCRSYYQTPDGRNAGLWPSWSFEYARRARFRPGEFRLSGGACAGQRPVVPAGAGR